MRTTPAEPTSDRQGHHLGGEEPMLPRDNPRRRREPDDEDNDDERKENSYLDSRSASRH